MSEDPLAKLWRLVAASRRLLADAQEVAQGVKALAPELRGLLQGAFPRIQGAPPPSPWEVLGLTKTASPEQAHKVYRALAAVYHPDVPVTGNPEHFKRLTEAYEAISRQGTHHE